MLFFGLLAIGGMMVSCSSGLERDAVKMAQKTDKCMQILKQADENGPTEKIAQELTACVEDFDKFNEEIEKKYTDEEQQKAFIDAYEMELKKIDTTYDTQTCLFMMYMAAMGMNVKSDE